MIKTKFCSTHGIHFAKTPKYKRVRFFSENNWYTLDHLKNDYMLKVYSDSNKVLHLEYANSMYADIDKKGKGFVY
jgi:hypothetical protein